MDTSIEKLLKTKSSYFKQMFTLQLKKNLTKTEIHPFI